MDELIPFFSAWRVMHMGTREVVDGLVAPDHRGPSLALRQVLGRWGGAWYWSDRSHAQLTLVRPLPGARRPSWRLHTVLFLLTILAICVWRPEPTSKAPPHVEMLASRVP